MDRSRYVPESKSNANYSPEQIRGMSLAELTEKYGTAGLALRLNHILNQCPRYNQDSEYSIENGELKTISRQLIRKCVRLASYIHTDDYRSDGPYINHPLRVAINLLESGIDDPNIIASALLHDIVENHPYELAYIDITNLTDKNLETISLWVKKRSKEEFELAAVVNDYLGYEETNKRSIRELAIRTVKRYSNPEVAALIDILSNPVIGTGEDKQEKYERRVSKRITTSKQAQLIKLFDFFDNHAGRNMENVPANIRNKLDHRYIHLYPLYVDFLLNNDDILPGGTRQKMLDKIIESLDKTLERLSTLEQPPYL